MAFGNKHTLFGISALNNSVYKILNDNVSRDCVFVSETLFVFNKIYDSSLATKTNNLLKPENDFQRQFFVYFAFLRANSFSSELTLK